jgi:hypothetical protein
MAEDRDIVRQVSEILTLAVAIDPEVLQRVVQKAHEVKSDTVKAPPELFEVSRQALRMFWHFRCNLEGVVIAVEPEEQPVAEDMED